MVQSLSSLPKYTFTPPCLTLFLFFLSFVCVCVGGGGGKNFVCLFDRFSLNTSKLYASFQMCKAFLRPVGKC